MDNQPTKLQTVFCIVDGEDSWHAFPVSFLSDGTSAHFVGGLKNLIKAAKAPKFDHISADELTLWKIAYNPFAPCNTKTAPISLKHIKGAKKLHPMHGVLGLGSINDLGSII
ncbi:hypothetical protein BGZ90_007628, partial [Linnemannia elongata]